MKTVLYFKRTDGIAIDALAIVTVESERTQEPRLLLQVIKAAVTTWVNTTQEGKEAFADSEEDFNIGDLAHYDDEESLKLCLLEEGLVISVETASSPAMFSYDEHLVTLEECP